MTAANDYEQQKQRYSRELAAYTLKQWNAVREAQCRDSEGNKSPTDEGRKALRRSPRENNDTLGEATPKPKENKNGMQVIDFANTSSTAVKGHGCRARRPDAPTAHLK